MKIAILMPEQVDVPALYRTRELVENIARAQPLCGEQVQLAIGIPEADEALWRAHEAYLLEGLDGVAVGRRLRWERVDPGNVGRMYMVHQLQTILHGLSSVIVPRDWGWNFADCDAWISLATPGQGAVLPIKPTAHYVADLSARITPDAYANGRGDEYWTRELDAFTMWRRSAAVLCGDPETRVDLIGYAGVRGNQIMDVPNLSWGSPALPESRSPIRQRSWLWLTEANSRHATVAALKGIALYLSEGGAIVPTIVSGDIAAFDHGRVVDQLSDSVREVLKELPRYALHEIPMLSRLLARGEGIWSSEVSGGEGLAMALAQRHGLPFVGQRYPLHERLAAGAGKSVKLYEKADPIAIADMLFDLETDPPAPAAGAWSPASFPELRQQQFGFVLDRLMEFVRA